MQRDRLDSTGIAVSVVFDGKGKGADRAQHSANGNERGGELAVLAEFMRGLVRVLDVVVVLKSGGAIGKERECAAAAFVVFPSVVTGRGDRVPDEVFEPDVEVGVIQAGGGG